MVFFWMPVEVWYYAVVPIVAILIIYLLFSLIYRRKKGTLHYNYVVDMTYSILGIIFCSILLCLLLGYSLATLKVLLEDNLIETYYILAIILVVLPFIPACFIIYLLRIFSRGLKKKDEILDNNSNIESLNLNQEESLDTKKFEESDFELKKKNV